MKVATGYHLDRDEATMVASRANPGDKWYELHVGWSQNRSALTPTFLISASDEQEALIKFDRFSTVEGMQKEQYFCEDCLMVHGGSIVLPVGGREKLIEVIGKVQMPVHFL